MKESATRMENIPFTMVIHNHVYGVYTRFVSMSVLLVNSPVGGRLIFIRRVTHQAAAEDSRW